MKKQPLFLSLASILSLTLLGGCGGSVGSASYSIWLYSSVDSTYYKDYNDNPSLQYVLGKNWNDKQLNIEFWVPPAGSAQNNYDTIVGSGDYPTLLQNSVSDPAPVMYQDGIILDLTEYVQDYMPNYYSLIQNNKDLKNATTFNVDGEERILSITSYNESAPYYFTGMVYRRDWIAKYGKNPKTGAAFHGAYKDADDKDSWEDDIVFPSGGTDPLTISDWEWMFDIFQKAQAALGITDGYCVSEYYSGYTWGTGGLNSCFGESNPVWYKNTSTGKVTFGGVSDSMRAYYQCLANWYSKGWLDQSFNERTRDSFYSINSTDVRLGKIGMWQGVESDLGGRLDLHNGGYTDGIYVAGASWPINDIYGTDECKNVIPNGVSTEDKIGIGFFAMDGADDTDLPSLLTMIDYLYSEEGAAIRSLGLNKDQLGEIDSSFYDTYGLSDGAYTKGADGRYIKCQALKEDSGGLSSAVNLDHLPGYTLVSSIDNGYATTYENSLNQWIKYGNDILIWGSDAYANMSSEDNSTAQKALNQVLGYMDKNAYKYIKGTKDINNDADWKEWCSALARFNYDKICDVLQPYVDMYN